MKDKVIQVIFIIVFLFLGLLFVIKFGGPPTLRLYVETGIGNCQKIPVLCISPEEKINYPAINQGYISTLIRQEFPGLTIHTPKDFTVVKEQIVKVYYKKGKRWESGSVIYLLCLNPNFFVNLFPDFTKNKIRNDHEFILHVMHANLNEINNLMDTFFVITKAIFTPDLGDQKNVRMVKFRSGDKRGFITYNQKASENYFDGNIIDQEGYFFKIYIKDKKAALDLDKVFAIIATIKRHD